MTSPYAWYAERAAAEEAAAAALDARADRLGRPRVAAALAAVALLAFAEPLEGAAAAGSLVGSILAVVAFVSVVARQRALRQRARGHRVREALAREGLARLARDWAALDRAPEAAAAPREAPEGHPYGVDLGLFGHASLERLCGPVTTAEGRRLLAEWLLEPSPPAEAAARREAVRALAPAALERLELAARGRHADPEAPAAVRRFLGWAEAPGWLHGERALRVASWLPPVTLGLLTLYVMALLDQVTTAWAAAPFWFVPLALQGWMLRRVSERMEEDFAAAAAVRDSIPRYAAQLDAVAELPGGATRLDELRARAGSDADAPERLRRLARRLDFVESRANAYYPVFNYLLLSDVHLLRSLEAWKAQHGARARGWVEALGELEALSALATLAHDHPDWTFPRMAAGAAGRGVAPREAASAGSSSADPEPDAPAPSTLPDARDAAPMRATGLGHPLLEPAACVRNDVTVPPPGAFLLVTGSNMSGKSTLLRAIGANVVLALAGGPVCAEALELVPVRLHTSMNVDDSLEAGVSRFMAELLRMKAVVEAARATGPGDPPVLYLLDEVLQGTNTGERRAGARTVLRHLLDEGAVGAVTTHDLTLHQAPDLERRAETFHFRESVARGAEGPRLAFDYKLRPGLSTTRNALVLLEAVGLGPEEGQPREEEDEAREGSATTGPTGSPSPS